MSEEEEIISEEDKFIYGHVMEALSGGLYPNKLDVLREYLQNSYDEIKEYINTAQTERIQIKRAKECKIEIKIDSDSLYIYDNGPGMDYQTLNEYRKIGFSRKTIGEHAGWRGIGKAAGFAVAERIYVNTSNGNGTGHQLVFRAKELREEIINAKKVGINIPLEILIKKYSEIKSYQEEKGSSYTTIELNNITDDSRELLDENLVIAHLSLIAPIPFKPDFKYSDEINEKLQFYIEDYSPVNIFVNGKQVYKPYLHKWSDREESTSINPPTYKTIYDNENNLIAFCWYCMHSKTGQIKVKMNIENQLFMIRGIYFRIHNIRIGDERLTRKYLWLKMPARAYHAIGEIFIIDKKVEPTSDRNDFVDNHARFQLFQKCFVISNEINSKAGDISKKSRAKKVIAEKESEIEEITGKIENQLIPKDLVVEYIYRTQDVRIETVKRKKATPEKAVKEKADKIIEKADKALNKLKLSIKEPEVKEDRVYQDIFDEIRLSKEARLVYDTIISILKNYFVNDPETLEEIIVRFEKILIDIFTT